MSLTPPPHNEGYASHLAILDEPRQLPNFELLKSLDDLDEAADEDEDDGELEDLDEEEDDLDEDYEEDDDEDDDDDDDDDEEEEDEDGGVKPLKMA